MISPAENKSSPGAEFTFEYSSTSGIFEILIDGSILGLDQTDNTLVAGAYDVIVAFLKLSGRLTPCSFRKVVASQQVPCQLVSTALLRDTGPLRIRNIIVISGYNDGSTDA